MNLFLKISVEKNLLGLNSPILFVIIELIMGSELWYSPISPNFFM